MTDHIASNPAVPRLTSLSHGGGCGCKIAPGVLAELLKACRPVPAFPRPAGRHRDRRRRSRVPSERQQAIVATTDFFMPIVDDPFDFGRIAATNALSDIYAMGGKPILALALVGMPVTSLPHDDRGDILRGGETVCRQAGIPVAGGHTSIRSSRSTASRFGVVHPHASSATAARSAGDVLMLGKPLGVGHLVRGPEKRASWTRRLSRR